MPEPTLFGIRIKRARETRGFTQAELAKKAGLTAIQISHIETGVKPSASAGTLVKLANALSVTVDYLLGRTEDMDAVGGPAAVILRSLAPASGETIERVAAIARTLVQEDEKKKGER